MMGRCGLGGTYNHIKAFGRSHSHIKEISVLKACWADVPQVCWGEQGAEIKREASLVVKVPTIIVHDLLRCTCRKTLVVSGN